MAWAVPAFQGDEQGWRVGQRPFQAQVAPEHFEDFRGQRYNAILVSFAKRTQLALGELQVSQLKSQDLAGAQTIEEHQAHESQIAIGAETLPELRDFFRREWHDDPPILFEAEAPGDGGAGPTVAERGPLGIAALEMHFAGRNFLSGVEAKAAAHCTEAMIHGLRCGFGILLELMTNIVDDRGLGHLGESSVLGFEPAREIEKVVGVDAKRPWGELPESLTIEEDIRPIEFSLVVTHSIWRGAGGRGRLIDHGELHVRPQPQRCSNCLTLSRSEATSRSAVLRTGGREGPGRSST
jgi:hypothetical protein